MCRGHSYHWVGTLLFFSSIESGVSPECPRPVTRGGDAPKPHSGPVCDRPAGNRSFRSRIPRRISVTRRPGGALPRHGRGYARGGGGPAGGHRRPLRAHPQSPVGYPLGEGGKRRGEERKEGEKGRPPRLSVAEVDAALSLYRARVEALDGSVFANDRKVRDLEKKIAAARQELDKIRNPRPTQEKVVRIDLAPAGKCRLAVTYRVPAAGFVPRYNARLVPGTGILSLELVADAWQRTGEDWKEATLTFSTARPGKAAQLPPLPPWELDFYQPPVARPMMKMRSEAADAAQAGAFAPEAKEEVFLPPPARRFASLEATLEGRYALGGSGEKKAFLLARQEQKAAVAWRAVPKMVEGAYLAANGRNETGLPVFSAPAALFLEDAYVGRGHMPDIPEGEEFRIDFGQDPGVRIQRKERERKREEGGVFAKVKRTRFRYEITAQNFRKEAVPLTVLDQVPFPRHKEIVVKDVEITGGGKAGEQGEITWEFSLAAGEKMVLGLSFTVEYPADKEIHGL